MAVQLRRPILVGGIGLSFGLWMLQGIHESVAQFDEVGVIGAIALGTGLWFFQKRGSSKIDLSPLSSPLERATVEQAIAQTQRVIDLVEIEIGDQKQLRQQLAQLTAELERQNLQVAIVGGKGVGKTHLVKVLQSDWLPQQSQSVNLQDTPTLFVSNQAPEVIPDSDLVLFVITGDLTDTEFQTLQQLKAVNQRTLVVLNKQDQYLPTDRALILQQLRQRMSELLPADDIVEISASPAPVKVRQHQPDASLQEWMEEQTPDLTALTQRISQIFTQEAQQLVWASTVRAASALKAEAKAQLNQARRDRVLPLIEQYQWIAGATAFANPVPALDLLATAAISTQLVIELGGIYQQQFSLSQAQSAAQTLGSLMFKLGLVELSTQTIGGILKSNAFTYVAGGVVQGVSAAYLTRLAGLSLIEYFQEQEIGANAATSQPLNLERVAEKLKKVFQENQRRAFLQGFVKQALGRLRSESAQAEPTPL
ncbi:MULTISPECIES: YcjF family protein [unclassified Coleofasciculus]|uniref:YcjF family protein n=1 Tax=unclassified Coleofasciculus TaxID=2692782 RepID=UPI00187FD57E|nr:MULTISPECIES: DUF697 domain-containing protein [unclassified Coleofasciculus]MBE9127044.1 DUF697 domain-containing protein [Coleofasciculus sp. LEGE 07081]MBE9147277.1 DUF697 domain-containing protein [Coleofasciculus sp. LEGE 07092]